MSEEKRARYQIALSSPEGNLSFSILLLIWRHSAFVTKQSVLSGDSIGVNREIRSLMIGSLVFSRKKSYSSPSTGFPSLLPSPQAGPNILCQRECCSRKSLGEHVREREEVCLDWGSETIPFRTLSFTFRASRANVPIATTKWLIRRVSDTNLCPFIERK